MQEVDKPERDVVEGDNPANYGGAGRPTLELAGSRTRSDDETTFSTLPRLYWG